MSRQPPGQQPPPVQRLRVRYAKRGRMRFTSHRDVSRAFERAVFRAGVPMAYSSGFNPHPRISYAAAAPTGAASEAEYLEIALARHVEPASVLSSLDVAMPEGLDVLEVRDAAESGRSLGDLLQASRWRITRVGGDDAVRTAVAAFLVTPEAVVERMTKKGLRRFDARAAVLGLELTSYDGEPALDLLLRHTEPAVRPDDVLAGLTAVSGWTLEGAPLLTRVGQGPLDSETGAIGDPLSPGP